MSKVFSALMVASVASTNTVDEQGGLLQSRQILQSSAKNEVRGGSCQRVLDNCTISQKIPVVGNLITNTFKDCVATFNQIRGIGLIQQDKGTDCAQLSQAVREWWMSHQDTNTEENEFILLGFDEGLWLQATHDEFDQHPKEASCLAGLAYLEQAVEEASQTIYQPGDKPDMEGKNAWKPGDVLQMMNEARQVCTCVDTAGSLLQTSSGSATKSGVMAAFATTAAQLKTFSGFYERSATAFDEFVGNFAWLPESMTQELRQYNADRHAWAAKMRKSADTFKKCQALVQTDASASACLQNGLKEASEAAELSVVDAEQMMAIVDAWSKYVPLCDAFVQFAKELPAVYKQLHNSLKSASLLQLGTLSGLDSIRTALGSVTQNK